MTKYRKYLEFQKPNSFLPAYAMKLCRAENRGVANLMPACDDNDIENKKKTFTVNGIDMYMGIC